VVVVALVLGGVALFNRDGSPPSDDSSAGDGSSGTEDEPGDVDPQISLDEVEAAYSSLGASLIDGASACERLEPGEGQAEVVTCTYQHLDVVLTTYEDADTLQARRGSVAEDAEAVEYLFESSLLSDTGEFYALRDADVDDSWMYWDSTPGLTSGYVQATATELPHKAAFTWFDQRHATDASRPFDEPAAPFKSEQMWELAKDYLGDEVVREAVASCGRAKVYDGDVDAVSCTLDGYFLYFYTKVNEEALLDERARARDGAVDPDETWTWFVDSDEYAYPVTGGLAKSRRDDKSVQVYWDDTALLVTAYIISDGPDSLRDATSYWCQC